MKINTTPYGVKFSLSSILLLMAIAFYQLDSLILSFVLITIIILILSSRSGIEFNKKNDKYRSYITYAGIKKGDWKGLKTYVGIVIISRKGTKKIMGFYQTSSINKSENIYQIFLVDKTHRNKMKIGTEIKRSNADIFANLISSELNIPLVKFSPKISQRTLDRKLKR